MEKNLHHPKTLPVFFLTELWERYGFYVVQTLLAIYLVLHFQWPDKQVYALIGSFTALTYLSPFVGGFIADKYLGQKASVLLGAFILLVSYIILSFSSQIPTLITALSSIAVGTGLLKPNIASLLGNQYPDDCTLRENGFTIFYLGITTGIILGTTLPSVFNQYFGWQIAFLSAAIGLGFSIITFSYGILKNNIENYPSSRTKQISNYFKSILILCLLFLLNKEIMLNTKFADMVFPGISLIAIGYILYSMFTEDKTQAKRTLIILFLCTISVMFWSFYFQMFMSLTLFIIRAVESKFLGIEFTPPYYVAIQSFGMIIIGYFLTRHPKHLLLSVEERATQIINKFICALGLMLLNYLLIDCICHFTDPSQKISPLMIIPGYLIISKAELLLSPIGTSAMTILSCRKKVSTMMGIFFVSLGLGGFFSGKLASLTAVSQQDMSIELLKQHYSLGFSKLSGILLIAFILSLILKVVSTRILNHQAHDSKAS
jgi:POT family proton-dependent oligopeptide transporter